MKYILKLLILLIFLLGFALGQEEPIDLSTSIVNITGTLTSPMPDYPHELWKRIFKEKGLIQVTFHDVDTYFSTIRSYEIYAEECYNDSTATTWDEYLESEGLTKSDLGLKIWIKMELAISLSGSEVMMYEHKKPTFEGFIKWLKK